MITMWRWLVLHGPGWLGLRALYEEAFEDGRNDQYEWSLRPTKEGA